MIESRPLGDPSQILRTQSRLRNSSLRWVLLSFVLLMVGMAAVDLLLAPPGEARSFISLSMGGVALLCHHMLQADQRRWGGTLMVVSVLLFSVWATCSYGSVRSASTLAMLGAVVMAGTYLGHRALLSTTVGGLCLLALLTWAEAGGWLAQPGFVADFRFWLMGSVVIAVVGALLLHTRKATDEAYLQHLNQLEDRVRLEHERDQSLRRFRRIFHLNPTALMIQQADSQVILEINPAFERRLGHSSEGIVGKPSNGLWVCEQAWKAHGALLFEKGRTDWRRCQWRRSDGHVIEVMVCSELSEDPGGMLILTTVIEVPIGGAAAV
jgi:PAS domain S-box-containing protein